jgi:hypothetical protein
MCLLLVDIYNVYMYIVFVLRFIEFKSRRNAKIVAIGPTWPNDVSPFCRRFFSGEQRSASMKPSLGQMMKMGMNRSSADGDAGLEIAAAKAWGEELPKSCPYFQPQ